MGGPMIGSGAGSLMEWLIATMPTIVLACAGTYLILLTGKAILALRYARSYPKPQPTASPRRQDLAKATIVQPILSGDPDLEAALADNLRQLPEARFLWLLDADDDEADRVTARLQRAHPAQRIERCTCPEAPPGINPKLFKLERVRDMVTDGAFVVVDDDTRLTREGLAALLAALDPLDPIDTGEALDARDPSGAPEALDAQTRTHARRRTLATGLPCYLDRDGLPSRLLAQFVNNNAALTYLPLLAFAPPPTINGMTYAMTPSGLRAIGGFAPLWGNLTDDLALARRVLSTGGTIAQTPYPQFIATTVRDLRHYRALMHRWFLFALLLLREQSTAWTVIITLLHGVPPLLLWLTLIATIVVPVGEGLFLRAGAGSRLALMATLALVVFRAVTLMMVQRMITGRSRHAPVLSIVSELLQPLHLIHALCQRRVTWRTRRYEVRANDDFRPA
jgi:ceramide glucosyltransferase